MTHTARISGRCSPERINPGGGSHRQRNITKVVAGDTPETLERVAGLYARVVEAGIHRDPSIRVAEAAKVIEYTQRDLNIALMNELAIIFHRTGIDTKDVLDAAGTQWNFLRFTSGLVGGHCIGVNACYLTHQAERMGYHPEVNLAGRRINDGMGKYVARQAVKCLVRAGRPVNGATVSVPGITFKEDCPDLRNSRVVDLVAKLRAYGVTERVPDPRADAREAMDEHGIAVEAWEAHPPTDAVVIAVAHREFVAMPADELARKIVPGGCLVDVKSVADREAALARGIAYWRL